MSEVQLGLGALLFPAGSQPVDTSEDAADSLSAGHLAKLRLDVLRFYGRLQDAGATPDEVALHFEALHNSTSPRVTELAEMGYLERTSRRRKTRTGRSAGVYVITRVGRARLEYAP